MTHRRFRASTIGFLITQWRHKEPDAYDALEIRSSPQINDQWRFARFE